MNKRSAKGNGGGLAWQTGIGGSDPEWSFVGGRLLIAGGALPKTVSKGGAPATPSVNLAAGEVASRPQQAIDELGLRRRGRRLTTSVLSSAAGLPKGQPVQVGDLTADQLPGRMLNGPSAAASRARARRAPCGERQRARVQVVSLAQRVGCSSDRPSRGRGNRCFCGEALRTAVGTSTRTGGEPKASECSRTRG